jgi:REP element-mobilizing transposase RayT
VRLSGLGEIVWREWLVIGERFPSVRLDEMVIMPDHLHGILWLSGPSEKGRGDPSGRPSHTHGPMQKSLGAVVGQLKSRVTKAAVSEQLWSRAKRLWQRGYYDRILRSEDALVRARGYVRMNPIRWSPR